MEKKIVIYGGAFNPPHIGHAIALETVMRLFPCDEIWVMPSAERRDKSIGVTGADRAAMLKIMLKELFADAKIPIKISTLELNRPQLTTTHDTLQELNKKYPRSDFYFLIGSDLLSDIKSKWVKGEALFENANFISLKRSIDELPQELPKHITILNHDVTWVDISSTFIRKLISYGHLGVPYVLPKIASYIREHNLYR